MTKMVNKNSSCRILFAVLLAAVMLAGGKAFSANDDPLAKRPPGRTAVSILWFENRAGTDAEYWRHGLKGSMSEAMKQVRAIRLCRGVGYARRELGIEKGSALKAEQARKIGEIVEAQRVIWGSYQSSSNNWEVTVFMLNVARGEVSEPITASGTDWFDLRDALVQQIFEQLKIQPSDEERQKWLRRETESSQAYEWLTKARAHYAENSPLSQMKECAEQAIKADPNYATAHFALSMVHANQGALEEAETDVRRALEIKPDLASAHHILGMIYLLKQQDKQALGELREALRLEPEDVNTLRCLSDFYLAQGEWEKATAYAEEAMALAPLNAELHAQMGWMWVQRHNRDRAMRELKEAERLADPDAPGHLNVEQRLAQSYRLLGEIPQAIDHYEVLVAEARKVGQNPETIDPFDETLQHMKATLTPTFVEARMPRTYTEQVLQNVLQNNLAPAELDMLVNPIAGNPGISRWARQLTAGTTNEIDKAKVLFDELIQRIQLDGGRGKRTAREVFAAWDDPDQVFSCQEFAKLYLVLAREVGIQAFYVHLGRDYRGKLVFHDCAIVFVGGKALLVDPAYRWFGVPHQEFTVLNDQQTVAHQLFQHGSGERSVERCRVAAKLHPDFAWGQVCLASALVDDDQYTEAMKVLKNAERLEPGRWDAHRLRGFMAVKDEDWNAALTHANKTLELNPEDARTYFILGAALAGLGREEEARDAYRTCLRHRPRDGMADHARRAIVQINERIGVESGKEFETAALMVAIKEGKIEAVRQMLAQGADANAQEASGATALMLASLQGHLDIVKLLLSAGADADAAEKRQGLTPLFIASQNGHTEMVKLLIAAHVEVNATLNKNGATALHIAAEKGHTDVVRQLLAAHAEANATLRDSGVTAMFLAAEKGHAAVIKLLLGAEADVNITGLKGITPLLVASQNGHTEVVKLLLEAGAHTDAAEKSMGLTPLFLASQNSHTEVVKLLIAGDAEVNATMNEKGQTALHIAAEKGHADVVKQLLAAHAEVNTTLHDSGVTAMFLASHNGHIDVIELLLTAGGNVNTAEKTTNISALYTASKQGYVEVVKQFLAAGADVHAVEKIDGTTPLFPAVEKGHAAVVKLLLGAEVDVNATNRKGITPLFVASQNGHTEVVKLLISAGADTDADEKSQGLTPLYVASQNGHTEVIKLLLANETDVNTVLKYKGNTPLTTAVANNRADVVKLLLDAGVDMNVKGISSEGLAVTPLEIARKLGHEKIMELLQSAQRKRGSRPVGKIEDNTFIDDDGDAWIKSENGKGVKAERSQSK